MWVFPKNRSTPKWMVYFMENPIKMDDLGVKKTYFWKHPCSCPRPNQLEIVHHKTHRTLSSTRRRVVVLIGPAPSMGVPRASTTRPNLGCETKTLAKLEVFTAAKTLTVSHENQIQNDVQHKRKPQETWNVASWLRL